MTLRKTGISTRSHRNQEHPHNLASRKNRDDHTSRPQGLGDKHLQVQEGHLDSSRHHSHKHNVHVWTSTHCPAGTCASPEMGLTGLSSPWLYHCPCSCFSFSAVCSSPIGKIWLSRWSLLCHWPALPCYPVSDGQLTVFELYVHSKQINLGQVLSSHLALAKFSRWVGTPTKWPVWQHLKQGLARELPYLLISLNSFHKISKLSLVHLCIPNRN